MEINPVYINTAVSVVGQAVANCDEDWIEINDGSSTQRYCGLSNIFFGEYYNGDGDNLGPSIPGPFTSTGTIAVRISSNSLSTASGFLGVVCCSAHVTTDLTPSEWFARTV